MKNLLIFFSFSSLLAMISCSSKESSIQSAVITNEGSDDSQAICMWKELSVRETPSEKGKYVTSIYLGEKLNLLTDTASEKVNGKKTLYTNVELIDGTKGWVRSEFIVSDAVAASFTKETAIYKRPDLMAPASKNFQAMDFVAIKTVLENGWAEVYGKRVGDSWFSSGWVKNENITREDTDVAFAVFYNRAMEVKDESKRNAEIQSLLANHELSSSIFFSVLTNMLAEQEAESTMVHADEEEDEVESDSQ